MLAAFRERAGLSQSVLAGRVGISQAALSRCERGHDTPDIEAFAAMAAAFGVTASALHDRVAEAQERTAQAARGAGVRGEDPLGAALDLAGPSGFGGLAVFAVAVMLRAPVSVEAPPSP